MRTLSSAHPNHKQPIKKTPPSPLPHHPDMQTTCCWGQLGYGFRLGVGVHLYGTKRQDGAGLVELMDVLFCFQQFSNMIIIWGYDILFMFGKVKQFLVDKAFGLAFMRYDRNNSGMLDKDQLASLINDAFQLLKVPRQVSWIQTAVLLKMFDQDNNDQISKQEAYDAFKNALAKFGGIGGIAQFAGFGKSSTGLQEDPYSHIPSDSQEGDELSQGKISGKLDYVPPEDIDESMLQKLPPVGQNLKPEDLKNHPPAQNSQWSQWGDQPPQSGNTGNAGNWGQWEQPTNQQLNQPKQENQQWSQWGEQAQPNQGHPN